jgi:predicted secreted protein
MDVVEFQRLTARVVATRNSESRAFLQAFDRAPGPLFGWSERTCANWRVWSRDNDALRRAVAELEAFLDAESSAAR